MKAAAILSGLLAVVFTVAMISSESFIFAAGGFWALTIVMIPPALDRRAGLFSIWSFVVLTVGIGMALRGLFISFESPDFETIDRLYYLGRTPEFFVGPLMKLLVGLGTMTLGYLALMSREAKANLREWDRRKVLWLGVVVFGASLAGAVLYAMSTGGFSPESLSAKRTPIPDIELAGRGFRSFGILRHLSSLAIFAHLIVLAEAFRSGRRGLFVLAYGLLFVACLQPFYASVRTVVAANFILSAAVVYFLGGKDRRWQLAGFGVGVAALIMVMTALRSGEAQSNPVESVVLNRNQIELPKTAHIIEAVPETLDFQYGKTLTRWLAAPIPREVWPDKPVIHPGPIIGNHLYGQRVAGVPPGLVAEMWWNFGWFGIVLGCFGFGMGLKWIENRFSTDPIPVVTFIAGPMLIGYEAVGSSIGSGIFRCVLGLVIIRAMLWVVRK